MTTNSVKATNVTRQIKGEEDPADYPSNWESSLQIDSDIRRMMVLVQCDGSNAVRCDGSAAHSAGHSLKVSDSLVADSPGLPPNNDPVHLSTEHPDLKPHTQHGLPVSGMSEVKQLCQAILWVPSHAQSRLGPVGPPP
jgi:hypothetical protein